MLASIGSFPVHLLLLLLLLLLSLLCSRHQEDATMAAKTVGNILNEYHEEEDDDPADVATPVPAVAGRFRVRAVAGVGSVGKDQSCCADPMLSLLSFGSEGDDADAEPSEDENDVPKSGGGGRNGRYRPRLDYSDKCDSFSGKGTASLPGTPGRGPEAWAKEYASETESRGRAGGRGRRGQEDRRRTRLERWLERAWEQRKSPAAEEDEADAPACRVLVRSGLGGSRRSICMDMEEVRACHDLGFQLPSDWTLEIPGAFSDIVADTSSGGTSPIANWRISSPGEDPKDVKARLKLWAQAVALTSTSRLGG